MQNTPPYKLFGRPGSGSIAVEAILALIGCPHEVVDVPKNEDGSVPDWYRALNPRSEVPTLQLPDGSIMTESAAMTIYLADAHPEAGLAPKPGTPARAQFLRWICYFSATVYSTDLRLYYPDRYSTDPAHADAVKIKASRDLARDYDVFGHEMGAGPFINGKNMSAADIYAAMLLSWSDDFSGLMASHPNLKTLYDAVGRHPKIAPVWQRHAMP